VIGSAGVKDDVPTFMLPSVKFGSHTRKDIMAVALDLDLINEASGFEQSALLGGLGRAASEAVGAVVDGAGDCFRLGVGNRRRSGRKHEGSQDQRVISSKLTSSTRIAWISCGSLSRWPPFLIR